MTHFADLYQLAIRILTATRNSDLGRLSLHSGKSEADAHVLLREAICQETMPSESGNAPWAVMRVFMRNLVNRAFAPVREILQNFPRCLVGVSRRWQSHGHEAKQP